MDIGSRRLHRLLSFILFSFFFFIHKNIHTDEQYIACLPACLPQPAALGRVGLSFSGVTRPFGMLMSSLSLFFFILSPASTSPRAAPSALRTAATHSTHNNNPSSSSS